MFWISACVAAGVAAALVKVITRLVPLAPPAKVPMITPPKVTLAPLTPICPAPTPWLLMVSWSFAVPLAVKATVKLPPLKSAESMSLTVPAGAIAVAVAFSV